MHSLLQVYDLTISYRSPRGRATPAVIGATFAVRAGEAVGLLGESGCGKTTTALALMRLLPPSALVVRGRVRFRDHEMLELPERDLERLRGSQISIIFQEPSIALNPLMRVGEQVAEVIHAHRPWKLKRCREAAEDILSQVRLPGTAGTSGAYPHELSGGQKQRVLIAQALACEPALVIADEPTTGLDTRTQAEVLDLLQQLKGRLQTSFLFISHHPGVLARLADRILVMYAGKIVEEGSMSQILQNPLHPFARGLLRSLPKPPSGADSGGRTPLYQIAGSAPDMDLIEEGCSFARRCPERMDRCIAREPEDVPLAEDRRVRCFLYGN
jgi:oligopeptide/dipeptide ABC transporter ATP-binding protein